MLYGMTRLLPELSYSTYDMLEFLIRILVSGIMGFLIGLERAKRMKEAGPRTHAIIACTAATLMILSKYSFADIATASVLGVKEADPSRIAAAIASGVSFLGVGVIFRQGANVHGLTTAAGILATSAVGMSIGSGLYIVGVGLTLLLLVMQYVLHRFPFQRDMYTIQTIVVSMDSSEEMQSAFRELLESHRTEILDSDLRRRSSSDGTEMTYTLTVRTEKRFSYEDAHSFMAENPSVTRFTV